MTRTIAALTSWALALASTSVHAQVRHRRPFAASIEVRYGFDNNTGSGCRDYNCGSRCYDGHTGTDFGIPTGTPVLASADGVVIATNNGCADTGYVGNPCGGRCGNYVQLEHADGSRSIFCHMQLNSLTVSRGQRVRCGQTLGRSASSGSSSGPHLHFGWRRTASGASIDSYRGRCTSSPGAWTDQRSYPLSPDDRCACTPSPETCNNLDDDCDGRIDDSLTRSCYAGPAGTAGRGICREGTQTCTSGRWGSCSGQVLPRTETCNRADDDCNGRVDDGVCVMDAGTRPDVGVDVVIDRSDARGDAPHDGAFDIGAVDVALVDVAGDVAEDVADDVAEDAADDAEFVDVGKAPDSDDVAPDRYDVPDDGCGCRTAGARATPTWPCWLFVVAITKRRRGARRPSASCSFTGTVTCCSND